jgi:hypothetical protein
MLKEVRYTVISIASETILKRTEEKYGADV